MSDIDFDELDKAVNSLIAKTPSANMGASGATPVIPAENSPQTPPAAPVEPVAPVLTNAPVSTVAPVVAPVAASQSLAGQRSSGRFMDVIHPSADMRSSAPAPQAVTPVAMPAPVVPPPAPLPTPQLEPVTAPVAPVVPLSSPEPSQTLESPFIAGAKMEKRPLGAFSSEPEAPSVELSPTGEVSEVSIVTPDTTDEPSVADTSTPLPEELQSDLLKIESGNSSETEFTAAETVPEAPLEAEKPAPALEPEPTGPTSIVQQYKEQKPTTDEKPGAIYDTSVYHKAITADGKKKPSWLWIVWIVLLLVVGVGAGALAYFYVLPLIK